MEKWLPIRNLSMKKKRLQNNNDKKWKVTVVVRIIIVFKTKYNLIHYQIRINQINQNYQISISITSFNHGAGRF